MPSPAPDPARVGDSGEWRDDWVVLFDPDHADAGSTEDRAASPLVIESVAGNGASTTQYGRITTFFAGLLTNAPELDPAGTLSPAAIVAGLVAKAAHEAFAVLRGSFAALAWDGTTGTLFVARDHIGLHPFYVARSGRQWLFSASPDALVSRPGVSRAIDAVALSEWLCGWYPAVEDTAYRDVKRVPPATVTAIRGNRVERRRYWDPAPVTEPVVWSREEDLEVFESLLGQAITRATRAAPAPHAVFLSGGVDSITVAASVADSAAREGTPAPIALSLVFPDAASNEEAIQAAVARRLGLSQHLVPFAEAAGSTGLLHSALELTASWPQPMLNLWAPAYMHLARLGRRDGARVICTGRGGDEWLTVTPYVLADYAARANVVGAWRMLGAWRRAHDAGITDLTRLLWTTAGRPLASATLDRVAPKSWSARRRQRLLAERPAWVAPDPAIRSAMDDRVDRWMETARPPQGFYVREMRTALFHPGITHDMEETHEFGRRNGQRVLHPFWDVDLVNALYRVPPHLLMKDGRSKWLLRRRLAARLPALGLERRVKVSARSVFRGLMAREAPAAWARLGGVQALADVGIASTAGAESAYEAAARLHRLGSGRLWTLLNFETWVRASAAHA